MRSNQTPKITVAVRKRPLNRKQLQKGQTDIVRITPPGQVVISQYKQKVDLTKYLEETNFNFDYAYDQDSHNEQIYEQSVRPLIENAFKGAKISCFAYGQTGSGKTYTMKGDIAKGVPGIYYLGAKEIFRYLELPQHRSKQITVTFYQIYCGKLYDLLNNRSLLQIRQDKKGNINVIGLNQRQICGAQQFLDIIQQGSVLRITSENNTNAQSSRSHAILQIIIREKKTVFSKISFIDLAGNQRGADHMDQNKQTKIDGAEINKSLLTLKECIRALDQGKSHTPFRGSKLTMVLKDSFIGYCNTIMICNISPNNSSSENTMNTLRYADRVKELKSKDEGEKLTKQDMMQKQLMLPRGNNKNTVKVNIERGDDQEDIMMKMGIARQMHENQQPFQKVEEKMDIQQPNRQNAFPQQYARKKQTANNYTRGNQKRMTVKEPSKRSGNEGLFKGREIEQQQQPLLSRNVLSQKIDQNDLNMANGFNNDPKNKLFQANNPPPMALNRNHYDAMKNLHKQFQNYKSEHQQMMNQQTQLLKEQYTLFNDYQHFRSSQHYEEEIQNVNHYLNQMERFLQEKQEMMSFMRNHYEKMKVQVRNAETVTNQLRQQQEQSRPQPGLFSNNIGSNMYGQGGMGSRSHPNKIYGHSNPNGMNFNGFNGGGSMADEQLLEGLGEEPKLF